MTDPSSPVEVVRAIYDALAGGDLASLFGHLDEACTLTQDDRLPWGGEFRGHDGFATFGLALRGAIESQVTIDAIFEADGEVIEVGRTKGTVNATGATFDVAEVHRWTIRDGKAVAAHFAIDTPAMLAALAARTD
jgi:ketosteroid isomerase-like protein